jgi:cardiolipin synthase
MHQVPLPGDLATAFSSEAPRWSLFHSNQAAWAAVFELCEEARHALDLEQYIFSPVGVGRRLLELLTRKARQGVAVRVAVDGIFSRALRGSAAGRALLGAGGEIGPYNGFAAALRHPVRNAPRLHRKTVLCDETGMMVGGTCYHDRMADWRDTMIRVDGPLPPVARAGFAEVWRAAHGQAAGERPAAPEGARQDAACWSYALSSPRPWARPDLGDLILERIGGATASVMLTTPYLAPDRRLWRALMAARDNGARVRLLMPARSDHLAADLLGHRFARALARRGIEVFYYLPTMLHAKLALVDGAWSAVSSFNLDLLSLRLNLESGVVSRSPALHQALAEQFEADLARARR